MSRQQSFDIKIERKKRDAALDILESYRRNLVKEAKKIAFEIARDKGKVCSPEVMDVLRERKAQGVNQVDARFMGAVFRKGWIKVGYVQRGSHGQPVSMWKLDYESEAWDGYDWEDDEWESGEDEDE